MSLYNESKKIITDLLGEEVARQIDSFENPEKYPEDFLNECIYFLSKIMGEEIANSKFQQLRNEYISRKVNKVGGKSGFR